MAEWPYNTSRWLRLREQKLRASPLCEGCRAINRVVPAVAVDHVRAISQGGDAFPALDGLRSLCTACHSAKTARSAEAGAAKTGKPRKGCNPDGSPLDPSHPWNRPSGGTSPAKAGSGLGPHTDRRSQLLRRGRPNG